MGSHGQNAERQWRHCSPAWKGGGHQGGATGRTPKGNGDSLLLVPGLVTPPGGSHGQNAERQWRPVVFIYVAFRCCCWEPRAERRKAMETARGKADKLKAEKLKIWEPRAERRKAMETDSANSASLRSFGCGCHGQNAARQWRRRGFVRLPANRPQGAAAVRFPSVAHITRTLACNHQGRLRIPIGAQYSVNVIFMLKESFKRVQGHRPIFPHLPMRCERVLGNPGLDAVECIA